MPQLKNHQCASKEPLISRMDCRARCFLFWGWDSPWGLDQPRIWGHITELWASLVVQMVKKKKKKNFASLWETQVQSLGREDPLEKGMATHSSILAWRIPWWATVHGVTNSWTQLSDYCFSYKATTSDDIVKTAFVDAKTSFMEKEPCLISHQECHRAAVLCQKA